MSEPVPHPVAPLRRTALYDFHVAHHGHLVPFAGWEMPLYYQGIIPEHQAVRTGLGFFDVSHMGILSVAGSTAAALLARRTTANVPSLVPGQCRYTFLLDNTGAIVDDLLITRIDADSAPERSFLVVPNAANAGWVYDLLRGHRLPDTEIHWLNPAVSILAVQGPKARAVLERLFGWNLSALKYYTARLFPSGADGAGSTGRLDVRIPQDLNSGHLVSRTGYTGEAGYELFLRAEDALALAERLVAEGAVPCGLGARDTLRLEKGFLLSGQDFHRDHSPVEAGQDRFIDLDHAFVGRDVIERQRRDGPAVRLTGLLIDAPGAIPRHGSTVWVGDRTIGEVTSGALSPGLQQGIALAYLPTPLSVPGTQVTVDIRGR
ncbi:MAG: glycine cleavage system aminomethyltransferase GcvT, partial [Thermoplasmata archaeon]|nr:glycine cleavage system aminomethyltransferase GcvT [Thermoplasmata archaeon]